MNFDLKATIEKSGGKVLDKGALGEPVPEAPVPETPVPETPVPEAPIPEAPVPEAPVSETPVPEAGNFDIASFNKAFESEYENEDSIKTLLSNGSKYGELETELNGRNDTIAELTDVIDRAGDPMDHFANEDEYIRQQFLINNKDKYDERSLNYLTNLSPSKIDQLDNWDALRYQLLLEGDTLEGNEAGVDELLRDQYGIEEGDSLSEASQLTRNKIALDSKKAKTSLKELYKDINIPEKIDWESQKTAIKESWDSPLKAIVSGIDEIQVAEGVSLSIDESMKEGLFDSTLNGLVSKQVAVSEDAAANISGQIRSRLLEKNMDKVVQVIQADAEEKAKEKYRKMVHNDSPLNEDTKGGGGDNRSVNETALNKFTKK